VAGSLPLPAGLSLDTPSWEQTSLVVRQVVDQLLDVIQQQPVRIAALEARVSRTLATPIVPPPATIRGQPGRLS
jgi:hypothetical protein